MKDVGSRQKGLVAQAASKRIDRLRRGVSYLVEVGRQRKLAAAESNGRPSECERNRIQETIRSRR